MDLEQRSTEDDSDMHFNQWFVDELSQKPKDIMLSVLNQLFEGQDNLPELDGYSQYVSGVVKSKNPYFYEVEYIKENGEQATFLDIIDLDSDEYLDAINELKALQIDEHKEKLTAKIKSNSEYSFSIRHDEQDEAS